MAEYSGRVDQAIRASIRELSDAALALQWARWPQLRASLSAEQTARMAEDTAYHLQFLAAALWADEQVLFSDYAIWIKKLFENLGLPLEWLIGSFEDIGTAVADRWPEHAAQVRAVIDVGIRVVGESQELAPSYVNEEDILAPLVTRYLAAVLSGDRGEATRLILEAADSGTSVADIYSGVFSVAQAELGRLWQMGRITVAQEHYATAVTQLAMSLLYPRLFVGPRHGASIVVACVGRELHELGARIVADFFEMDGWSSHYLGANTPVESIVSAVVAADADMIALSATMSFRIIDVSEVIAALRADARTCDVPILVGGYPFNLTPTLWRRVGADAYAESAHAAIAVGDRLVGRAQTEGDGNVHGASALGPQ